MALLYTAVAGPIVAHCVHRDDKAGAFVAGCLSIVACACAVYSGFASFNEVKTSLHIIPVAQIWFSAGCHLCVGAALLHLRSVFGTAVMLAIAKNQTMETVRLIDHTQIEEQESVQRRHAADTGHHYHQPATVVKYQSTLAVPMPDDTDGWTSDDER